MHYLPDFQQNLKENILNYDDTQTRFIKKSLQTVPFFATLENKDLYEIIFSLETSAYKEDHIFQRPGDGADTLFVLQRGIIEVYTENEGKEFVLERLYRGSIINYRTFF